MATPSTVPETEPRQGVRAQGRSPGELLARYGAPLGLILLCIFLTWRSEFFLTPENIANIGRQSAIIAILSLGQLAVILTAGIDLSVGALMALCVTALATLAIKLGVNAYVAILACLVLGLLLGVTNGLLLTKLHLPHPFISTLGMMNVARGLALILTGGFPISNFPDPAVTYIGSQEIAGVPVAFILVVALYLLGHFVLTQTTVGRQIYAVGGNPEAARLSGINVSRTLILVYAVSGLMAGVGALVLAGRVNSGPPNAGLGIELDTISAVIIGGASFFGGRGTAGGTMIGVLFIAVLRNGFNLLNVPGEYQTLLIGIIIVVAVYVDVLRRRSSS
ncbi:MAG: ABC transporter permease [Chloroflexota bacterium]